MKPDPVTGERPSVEVAECIWCGGFTLNPTANTCGCGEELAPTTKLVPAGTRIRAVYIDHPELTLYLPGEF